MVEARRVWKATHDAGKTLAALRGFHCTERQLLQGLKRCAKNDVVTALSAVCSMFMFHLSVLDTVAFINLIS